MTVNILTLKS